MDREIDEGTKKETNRNNSGFRGQSEGESVMEEIKKAEMELTEEGVELQREFLKE